jgi:hypothetical protein
MGGIRLLPEITPATIHNLARGMTLKNAAANLPYGGGKAGIVAEPGLSAPQHTEVVRGFARLLSHYRDLYLPGPDVGTNDADMKTIAIENGLDSVVSKPVDMGGNRIDQLGAAAGGGFPQWNCRCPVCRLAWAGDTRVEPCTQASLAVPTDGERWILLNASPDLRAQVQATPALQPRAGTRDTPIAAVVLTGAEVDQVAGLLALRERQNFTVLATSETLAALDANQIFRVLAGDVVTRKAVARNVPFALPGDLEVELFSVPGKVALYLEDDDPALAAELHVVSAG